MLELQVQEVASTSKPYLSEDIDVQLSGCCHSTLAAKNVITVATGRAGVVRHVLYQPQDGHAAFAEHGYTLASIDERQVLHPTSKTCN